MTERAVYFNHGFWHLMIPESIDDMGYPISPCPKAYADENFQDHGLSFGAPMDGTCAWCWKRRDDPRYVVAMERVTFTGRSMVTEVQHEQAVEQGRSGGVARGPSRCAACGEQGHYWQTCPASAFSIRMRKAAAAMRELTADEARP